ncbi:conserved hypothetical protein [Leishmania infantum JPCM5]|uniref:PHD-type domain-containing protein n=2 Tax=Leishmania infantum TaxID=5671 RepID=A4I1S3_LEIIN|nr:conserved hypothetical protein [Leishmania infantum JPCM5]CAM68704.1 conserved hypothetical protein [Leishmania infantum JPCM5]|eukprot:XP_001466264.1 conserved hypothetical protein [Leishmania infantum JPCM5]
MYMVLGVGGERMCGIPIEAAVLPGEVTHLYSRARWDGILFRVRDVPTPPPQISSFFFCLSTCVYACVWLSSKQVWHSELYPRLLRPRTLSVDSLAPSPPHLSPAFLCLPSPCIFVCADASLWRRLLPLASHSRTRKRTTHASMRVCASVTCFGVLGRPAETRMDPALAVMSPFQNEARGIDGMLEDAVEEITRPSSIGATSGNNQTSGAADGASVEPPALAAPPLTQCSFCAQSTTTRAVPKDGMYVCTNCLAEQGSRPRLFPLGTFKCCPTSTEAMDGDVVRCAGCYRWYHVHCVGITDSVLRNYVTLSTTSWYCPEPACCDRVLRRHLKR